MKIAGFVLLLFLALLLQAAGARAETCNSIADKIVASISGAQIEERKPNVVVIRHPAAQGIGVECGTANSHIHVLMAANGKDPSRDFISLAGTIGQASIGAPSKRITMKAALCFDLTSRTKGQNVDIPEDKSGFSINCKIEDGDFYLDIDGPWF